MSEVPSQTNGDDAATALGDDVTAEPSADETAALSPPADGEPPEPETTDVEFDAEAHAAESAEHDAFLQTYQPCITRLPQALEDERAEQRAAEQAQADAEAQAQAERDEVTRRQLEAQAQADAEAEAYRQEHYPE